MHKQEKSIDTLVIAPYFEDDAADQFVDDLSNSIGENDYLIIVDDGSIDRPFNIEILREKKLSATLLKLKRNVGHQTAIACGLSEAVAKLDFKRLVVMDSDGEDRPHAIKVLVDALEKNQGCDIVAAARKSRVESWRFKSFYWVYQLIFKIFVGRSIRFGNFLAMTPSAASRLAGLNETGMHIAASAMNSRLRIKEVMIDRGARYSGSSKMNLVSLTLHGLRSVMVFAETVLVRITLFCAAAATIIVSAMFAMIILKLSGLAIPGWFSTVSGILLLLLFQVGVLTLLVLLSAGNLRSSSSRSNDYQELIASRHEV